MSDIASKIAAAKAKTDGRAIHFYWVPDTVADGVQVVGFVELTLAEERRAYAAASGDSYRLSVELAKWSLVGLYKFKEVPAEPPGPVTGTYDDPEVPLEEAIDPDTLELVAKVGMADKSADTFWAGTLGKARSILLQLYMRTNNASDADVSRSLRSHCVRAG